MQLLFRVFDQQIACADGRIAEFKADNCGALGDGVEHSKLVRASAGKHGNVAGLNLSFEIDLDARLAVGHLVDESDGRIGSSQSVDQNGPSVFANLLTYRAVNIRQTCSAADIHLHNARAGGFKDALQTEVS